jgi:fatty-acid peroxygenase
MTVADRGRPLPRDSALDSSLTLFAEGNTFIQRRCRRLHSDIFETRLLLQPTICMQGEEAARLFYDSDRFERQGARPGRVQKTLLGVGGVQGLDGAQHAQRKHLFVEALMSQPRIAALLQRAQHEWHAACERWQGSARVVLFDEAQEIFCRAVCAWAGVPLAEAEVGQRTADLAAMIDSAGRPGLGYWRGRRARSRSERWAARLVEETRSGRLNPGRETALQAVAMHRDMDGATLPARIAAVALLNILRPTVAIARFVTFGALALHEHPECREHIAGDDACLEHFVHEVRRYYPFFPFLAARVRHDFVWHGYRFPAGRRVMLDLYGTNHDARIWSSPESFRPQRFAGLTPGPFSPVPQGGGDYRQGHRCPGEWITIALMKQALHLLARDIRYRVPPQDLTVDLDRMPTLPASGFVIDDVAWTVSPSPV